MTSLINPSLDNFDDLEDELLLSCNKIKCFLCENRKSLDPFIANNFTVNLIIISVCFEVELGLHYKTVHHIQINPGTDEFSCTPGCPEESFRIFNIFLLVVEMHITYAT